MNYQLARRNMIEQQLRTWHTLNAEVLHIIGNIPREDFVPPEYRLCAYGDFEIPLIQNQRMLCPNVVGRALEALQITPQDKVLEIGTGTGYVTACLAAQAQSVVSIDIFPELLALAKQNLKPWHQGSITLIEGNGALGWQSLAPYDVIFVSGAYPEGIPDALIAQLKPGGRLFAICGQAPRMEALLLKQIPAGQTKITHLFETCVPPLLNVPCLPVFRF